MRAHRLVVGVEIAGGKVYGKATGMYYKHHNYSEQWNPRNPFQLAHDFQQAQSFTQQMKRYIDQNLRCGLDNFTIESFEWANTPRMLLAEINFMLSDDSWIEDHSPTFGTFYYREIFKSIQFVFAHLAMQAVLDFEPGSLVDSESRRIYSAMNTCHWWWNTQNLLPAEATIVSVICAPDSTQLINFSGNQHAWPLYLTIGTIRKVIRQIPKMRAWILVRLIQCSPQVGKNTDDAWHSAIGSVVSPLCYFDITSPSWIWNCSDRFGRQCNPILAVSVRDYPEHVMIAQVTDGWCPICDIPQCLLTGHSTCQALANSRAQHVYSELLDETNNDVLHILHVQPICNQFWQLPLFYVSQLWQPDELH